MTEPVADWCKISYGPATDASIAALESSSATGPPHRTHRTAKRNSVLKNWLTKSRCDASASCFIPPDRSDYSESILYPFRWSSRIDSESLLFICSRLNLFLLFISVACFIRSLMDKSYSLACFYSIVDARIRHQYIARWPGIATQVCNTLHHALLNILLLIT